MTELNHVNIYFLLLRTRYNVLTKIAKVNYKPLKSFYYDYNNHV